MPQSPRDRAFTLIELLTVISILTLLIGILLPTLSKARTQAKATVCLTRLKMIGTSAATYLAENRDYFFPVRFEKIDLTKADPYIHEGVAEMPRWQWFLKTDSGPVITKHPRLADYPSFNDESLPGGVCRKMSNELFTCPMLTDEEFERDIRDGAFGYNYQYLGNTRRDTTPGGFFDNFPVASHTIASPVNTVIIADSRGAGPHHGPGSFMLDPPRLATEKNATRFGPGVAEDITDELMQYSPAETRHGGKANTLFVDSHADAMTLKELGYELDLPSAYTMRGLAFPVRSVVPEKHKNVSNRLWNGQGKDPMGIESFVGPSRDSGGGRGK